MALVLSFSFWRLWQQKQNDYQRIFEVGEALNHELTVIRAENGQLIAQNSVLTLKSKELEAILPGLASELRDLNVRLNRAKSVSSTGFMVQTPAIVAIRDSVLFDTVQVRIFNFQDGFFKVEGTAIGAEQHLKLSYEDTLVQVVYRGERERPWLWVFSPRKLMQRVSMKNPNANIYYSQTISIER